MMKLDLSPQNLENMKQKSFVIMNLLAEIKNYAKMKQIIISDAEFDSILKRILWE